MSLLLQCSFKNTPKDQSTSLKYPTVAKTSRSHLLISLKMETYLLFEKFVHGGKIWHAGVAVKKKTTTTGKLLSGAPMAKALKII